MHLTCRLRSRILRYQHSAASSQRFRRRGRWSNLPGYLSQAGLLPRPPIWGLMGADSKAFLSVIKLHVNPVIQRALCDIPQYAYRQRASTCDALLRASLHCAAVRQQLAGYVEDHTARVLGVPERELLGGMMVSLDLSKAFDKLRYEEMYISLVDAGVPDELSRLLLHIHSRTIIRIEHGGKRGTTCMRRGLRQGCGVAPMIYACWTIRLCKLINLRLGNHWMQKQSSIFADDKHFYWSIGSCQDLHVGIQQLRHILVIIHELGMTVNFQKSLVVIMLKGRRAVSMMYKYTKWWNGGRCLILRTGDHDTYIPTKDSMTYLGTILSYQNFELQTAQHRAAQANWNFAQLKDVLRTNGALSRARRVEVYRTCIWTSLTYGIVAVGATTSSCRILLTTAAMHLRKLLRVHQKGQSNEMVLMQAGLSLTQYLCQCADRQACSLKMDVQRDAVLRQREDERSAQVALQLQAISERDLHASLVQVEAPDATPTACPVCGIILASAAGLHQHLHQKHPEVAAAASINFRREEHSLFGLPHCRFCRVRMGSWQMLTKHIRQGMCIRIKEAIGRGVDIESLLQVVKEEEIKDLPQRPVGDGGEALQGEVTQDLMSIILDAPVTELVQHSRTICANSKQCLLCGQRLLQAGRVKTHWRASHEEAWKACGQQASAASRSLCALFRKPCPFCGSQAKDIKLHSQQCPMMFQIQAMRSMKHQGLDWRAMSGSKQAQAKQVRNPLCPPWRSHWRKAPPGRHRSWTTTQRRARRKTSSGPRHPRSRGSGRFPYARGSPQQALWQLTWIRYPTPVGSCFRILMLCAMSMLGSLLCCMSVSAQTLTFRKCSPLSRLLRWPLNGNRPSH